MRTVKQIYSDIIQESVVNEGLGDLLGDKLDAAKQAVKDKLNITPGGTNAMSRLFNVENDIIKLCDKGEYRALGKLLIEKKIPQNFAFKRITLFGRNNNYGATSKTYKDVPLFFAITAKLIDKGQDANLNKIYAEIASAGIQLKTYLNRIDPQHKDLVSFILLSPNKPNISSDGKTATPYEKICTSVIKTLLLYGYDGTINDGLAIHTAIRMQSIILVKAFFESKYPIKLTADIEQEADQVDNAQIIAYFETLKTGKPATTTTSTPGFDFSKYTYDPKVTSNQKLKIVDAMALLKDLAAASGKPYDATKLANIAKNKALIKAGLVPRLQALKLPVNIEIV